MRAQAGDIFYIRADVEAAEYSGLYVVTGIRSHYSDYFRTVFSIKWLNTNASDSYSFKDNRGAPPGSYVGRSLSKLENLIYGIEEV